MRDDQGGATGAGRPAGRTRERIVWIDATRGMVICFITVFHATPLLDHAGMITTSVSDWIYPYRFLGMALFFMVSGMNSLRFIEGTREDFIRQRVAPIAWMILLWTAIAWYPASLINDPRITPNLADAPREIVMGWLMPHGFIWFLWALAGYLLLSRAIRRLPRDPVVALCIWTLIGAMGFTEWHMRKYGLAFIADNYTLRMSIVFFPAFHLGYLFREQLIRLGSMRLPVGLFAFVAIGYAVLALADRTESVLGHGLLAAAALALGVMGSIYVARTLMLVPGLGQLLPLLGRRTLPIYLAHALFLPPLVWLVVASGWPASSGGAPLAAVAVGLASIPLALGFGLLAVRFGMLWLFTPPAALVTLALNAMSRVRRRSGTPEAAF